MSEKVDEQKIKHIAHLAKLRIREEEIEEFESKFKDILDSFSKLDNVDIEIDSNDEFNNIVRPDAKSEGIDVDEFMNEQGFDTESQYFES